MIPKLPSLSLSPAADEKFTEKMTAGAKEITLKLYPNAWMKVFGLTDEDVAAENRTILEDVEAREAAARARRKENKKMVKGAKALCREAINMTYLPDEDGKRIYVYAKCKEIRIRMIQEYKAFCERCRWCWEEYKKGNTSVEWPPGAFVPAPPLRMNAWRAP